MGTSETAATHDDIVRLLETAAARDIILDAQIDNFGVKDGEVKYVDTADYNSVRDRSTGESALEVRLDIHDMYQRLADTTSERTVDPAVREHILEQEPSY